MGTSAGHSRISYGNPVDVSWKSRCNPIGETQKSHRSPMQVPWESNGGHVRISWKSHGAPWKSTAENTSPMGALWKYYKAMKLA